MSRALLCIVLLAALSGCPPTASAPCETDAECPDGRCRYGGCGPVCLDDTECGGSQVCAGGTCAPRPQCTRTEECAAGFACTDGRCLCGADSACAANQQCRNGQCQTQGPCESAEDCPAGQRCEPIQGVCQVPCTTPVDCAPNVDPRVAALLYVCQQGNCLRQCLSDATCSAGFICEAGLCARAECATKADCPSGQYCTSATAGRCAEYRPCTSNAECGPNTQCRAFPQGACPPGFDCGQRLCQALPRCLVDTDCAAGSPAFCQEGHCQPTTACEPLSDCGPGRLCVAGLCMPSGCRGHSECTPGQACVEGACRTAPRAADIISISLTPRSAVLVVGDTVKLSLVAFALDGSSFPLAEGTFSAVDASGQPSSAVTVSPEGVVTAVSAGTVRVQARPAGAAVSPQEATLTVLPSVDVGRRVVVVSAFSRRPLAGVEVLGCDAPPTTGPCPAPVTVTTEASGVALFPDFTGVTAHFSAASPELRADGHARYDRVSVAATPARDVLLPLTENPVHGAAGFNASISFNEVHSSGEASIGFSLLSASDVTAVDLGNLFGETFRVSVPGVPQRVAVPGSLVATVSSGFFSSEIKTRSLGLGEAGRRTAVAFAGKVALAQATSLRTTDLLAYAGSLDYALQPLTSISHLPHVPDAVDLDGDGLCADPQRCPQGREDLPDYDRFTGLSHRPRRVQLRRTEVVVSPLPAGLDTAVVAAVELSEEAGVVPLGLTSRTAGATQPDGTRPVGSVLLRSGAPYGGAEVGRPGVWALATSANAGTGTVSGWLFRGDVLPARVEVPPLLPLPQAAYSPSSRTLAPDPTSWSALGQAGVGLVRLTLTGARGRHVVYLPLDSSQASFPVPESPSGAEGDPAAQPGVSLEVVALRLTSGNPVEGLLDASGTNLLQLPLVLEAYSRSRPP